jgi:hypothetical protein
VQSAAAFFVQALLMNWVKHLRSEGYVQFNGLTPPSLVSTALAAIRLDLGTNYDSNRQVEYDNQSYCPDLRGSTPIMDLLVQSPIYETLDQVFDIERIIWDAGQIAIRKARNNPVQIPPEPHLDGFSSGLNGLQSGRIYNHTALIGVFLTPVRGVFAGNFAVWPGSHDVFESYFRVRGPVAMSEPCPRLAIGNPVQLECEAGDVVLAHYQLGHAAAVNTSDIDRVAVYFRVTLRSVELDRWRHLIKIWEGWNI